MTIENTMVVGIHYTLKLDTGELVDTTEGEEPLVYLAGAGQIVPGLDQALIGKKAGDTLSVTLSPADAYGEFDEDMVQTLSKEMFTGIDKIEVGMEFQTQSDEGDAHYVVVTDVSESEVTVDANHEFAGKTLVFDVTVDSVREATEEEIEHGHAH